MRLSDPLTSPAVSATPSTARELRPGRAWCYRITDRAHIIETGTGWEGAQSPPLPMHPHPNYGTGITGLRPRIGPNEMITGGPIQEEKHLPLCAGSCIFSIGDQKTSQTKAHYSSTTYTSNSASTTDFSWHADCCNESREQLSCGGELDGNLDWAYPPISRHGCNTAADCRGWNWRQGNPLGTPLGAS